MNPGRNDPCPCGSGGKYKKCCGNLKLSLLVQSQQDEVDFAAQIDPGKDAMPTQNEFKQLIALYDAGRYAELESRARLLTEQHPDSGLAWKILGTTLQVQGKNSLSSLLKATELLSDHADAHNNLAAAFKDMGRLNDAEDSYRRAIQIKPDYFDARYNLTKIGKVKAGDENMAELIAVEKAMQNGAAPLSIKDAVSVHFALGKCYDDIGDHEKAFPHFLEGGRLKRSTLDYDPDKTAQKFSGIMRNFDVVTINKLRGSGNFSYMPIFVLGMPRSGTTLTEQIIASHPEVHGAGELSDLMAIAQRDIAAVTFPDNLRLLDPARLTGWGMEYVAGLQRRAPDMPHVTDKMPGNFLAIGLIHLMLPNAKIIHVNRNPVDTCLSCFTTLFGQGQEHTYDLAELGRYYADYTRLMEHWRKVLPAGAFLDVRYEDIVADQEAQSRRLIEYCGLEWNDACLDFHKNKRAVRTASVTQVRQPIYKSSVERWRPYEKFLGPLFDALGELAPGR
jgi:tetratricopeptide (TPR) repeat protein